MNAYQSLPKEKKTQIKQQILLKKRFTAKKKQAQLGAPHLRIQVELGFILQTGTCQILNFAQNPRQSQNCGGTPHRKSVYLEGGTLHIFSEQGVIGCK